MPVALGIITLRFFYKAGEAMVGAATGKGIPAVEPSGSFAPHADAEIDGPDAHASGDAPHGDAGKGDAR